MDNIVDRFYGRNRMTKKAQKGDPVVNSIIDAMIERMHNMDYFPPQEISPDDVGMDRIIEINDKIIDMLQPMLNKLRNQKF